MQTIVEFLKQSKDYTFLFENDKFSIYSNAELTTADIKAIEMFAESGGLEDMKKSDGRYHLRFWVKQYFKR